MSFDRWYLRSGSKPFWDPASWASDAQTWSDPKHWDKKCWYAPEWCRDAWSQLVGGKCITVSEACHTAAWCIRAVATNRKTFGISCPDPLSPGQSSGMPLSRDKPLCFKVTNASELFDAWEVLGSQSPLVPFCFYLPPDELELPARAALVEEIKEYIQLHPTLANGGSG